MDFSSLGVLCGWLFIHLTGYEMTRTPISDANITNTEPHNYQMIPYEVARDLELQLAELKELTKTYLDTVPSSNKHFNGLRAEAALRRALI